MTRLDKSGIMLCHDGTPEGVFSLIFYAYEHHMFPDAIASSASAQPMLGQEIIDVPSDFAHAQRVRKGILRQGGSYCFKRAYYALLSDDSHADWDVFNYVVLLMEQGVKPARDLSNPIVAAVEKHYLRVVNEQEKMRQFTRFEELDNGIFVSVINPSTNLLGLLAHYFSGRFNTQPFIIYDENHKLSLVYNGRRCELLQAELPQELLRAKREKEYQRMWKTFYDSLTIEQRYNPDLRVSFMPKKYWKNLTEITMALEDFD